jgi:O-antigen/teichoic acid export membrane protein
MDEAPDAQSKVPLRQRAISGARWTTGSAGVAIVTHLVQLAVLARLLDPRDFGLAASVMIVVGLAAAFGDAGLSNAIIAKKPADRQQLSSLYWANLATSWVVGLIVLCMTPVAVAYFGQDELWTLVPLAAIAFAVIPVGQQFGFLLQRELKFNVIAKIEACAYVGGTGTAIALAAAGAGAASFVAGFLAMSAIKSGGLAAYGWRRWKPALHFRRSDLDGYVGFGLYQIGERFTNYLGANVDYLLIGRFLGPEALGIYSIAYQIVTLPKLRLNPIVTRVAFPVMALRQSDNAALRRGFLDVSRVLAMVCFPLLVGLAVTAPHFVPAVYGPQWHDSIAVIQIEVVLGIIFVLGNPNGALYLAKDRPDIGFKLTVFRLVTASVAILAVVNEGLVAVAWAYVGITVLQFLVARVVLQRLIGLTVRDYAHALRHPTFVSLAMAGVVLAATPLIEAMVSSHGAVLAVQVALGAATYVLTFLVAARSDVRQLAAMVVPRRAQAASR